MTIHRIANRKILSERPLSTNERGDLKDREADVRKIVVEDCRIKNILHAAGGVTNRHLQNVIAI